MKIVKTVKVELTDEEREILQKAQDILINFENEAVVSEEDALQEMYEEHVEYYQHETALPTAIDLLDTILNQKEKED